MRSATFVRDLPGRLGTEIGQSAVLAAFTGTIFLSAFLLFSVQPMFARMVLPKLGGAPAVWAVSMCFFQAVLLAGYGYAHLLTRYLPARLVPLIHVCVIAAGIAALPIGLPASFSEPPAGNAYAWLIGLLAAGVGLPFFAISANAPLLQAWFAGTGHPHARDPYFLYAASNAGSLIALLAYPVAVEPFLGLAAQSRAWAAAFFVLGLAIVISGLLTAAAARRSPRAAAPAPPARPVAAIAWRQRAVWVVLAAIPSGLLVAFTSFVTTDIASAPFLWVLPLAAFLATFIVVFRDRPLLPHAWMLHAQPILVAGVLIGISTVGGAGWTTAALAGSAAFLVTTLVCHRELYERRPASAHLTEFYLWMSVGGVIGGVLAAIVAPNVFSSIWEFPLLLIAGLACRRNVLRPLVGDERRALLVTVLGGLAALVAIQKLAGLGLAPRVPTLRVLLLLGASGLAILSAAIPARQLALMAIAGLSVAVLPSAMNRGEAERSFFGVHRIAMIGDEVRVLLHGTTIHGAERVAGPAAATARPVPMVYYYPGGPMAQALGLVRADTKANGRAPRVGVVGLGTGALACNAEAGEAWRFYEIDPVVVAIARDPRRFTYLSRCQPGADIVLGDARLTLAKERSGTFDYLVIDAFASDAVPVHLMTREAIALYLDRLSPGGVLALHVSNRHLDLYSVAASTAKSLAGTYVALATDTVRAATLDAAPSHVVLVTRSAEAFARIMRLPYAAETPAPSVAPWTDDYANVLAAVWRNRQ